MKLFCIGNRLIHEKIENLVFGEYQEVEALYKLKQKLKSQTGASITFALLLFLVCAVVGSAVLVAGTAAAGRMSKIAEMDQRYYAVNSAARLLNDLMERDEIRYQPKESEDPDSTAKEYEWFIKKKKNDNWASPSESDPLPLTVFLAKQALDMPKNSSSNFSFNLTPGQTREGAKLNVSVTGTITKGEADNSADLFFELIDKTDGNASGNYRISAYFANTGGDSFFHWKLYDIESIRLPEVTASVGGGTP